jgi:nitrite reductase/ring-hydroxylating ferredoxin subunit
MKEIYTLARMPYEGEADRSEHPQDFPALPPLPTARYVDEGFYALEMEYIWRKSWLPVGHVSDLPEPSSYFLFDKLGESIVVSRASDGVIHAFHNSCLHRGSRLVLDKKGKAERFICPYHAWTYSPDGRLLAISEPRDFCSVEKASLRLTAVRCEVWRGFIFLNLDEGASSLLDHLASIPNFCEDFPFEEYSLKRHNTFVVDCNWKVAYDNFMEIYHTAMVHPALTRFLDLNTFSITLLRNGHAYFTTRRIGENRLVPDETRGPDGSFEMYRHYVVGMPIFPNLSNGLDLGGFNNVVFWPDGPRKTIIEVPAYGVTREDDPHYWDNLEKETIRVIGEDIHLLPGVDRSYVSGRIKYLNIGYKERAIYWYHEEIDRWIGRERINPELRVEPILARYAIH